MPESDIAPDGSPVAFHRRVPPSGEPELIHSVIAPGASVLDAGLTGAGPGGIRQLARAACHNDASVELLGQGSGPGGATALVGAAQPGCPQEESSMSESSDHRVAVVQRPPVLLDRDATLARAVEAISEAADAGARLVVFPETFVPGYPEYIWSLKPGGDHDLSRDIHARLIAQSVDLAAGDLQPVQRAAAERAVHVVIGIHERDAAFSRASLYNTLVTIGADGSVLNRHRKLVPTNPERMVWAPGDASGLQVMDTPVGRLGGLICWENYMPLARFALYAQGIQLYVASTWDEGDVWEATLRHIAKEGRCWVIGSGSAMRASDVPADFPDRERLYPDPAAWLNRGGSMVVAPGGAVVSGPLRAEYGILYADCDPAVADAEHYTFDAAGHYSRPDVFQLRVTRTIPRQVSFDDSTEPGRG